jgi:hypothetical protein
MTKEEATNVLGEFRKAFRALNQVQAMQAFNALMNSGSVTTTNFNLAGDFGSALATLRTVFDKMDQAGIRFPPN